MGDLPSPALEGREVGGHRGPLGAQLESSLEVRDGVRTIPGIGPRL